MIAILIFFQKEEDDGRQNPHGQDHPPPNYFQGMHDRPAFQYGSEFYQQHFIPQGQPYHYGNMLPLYRDQPDMFSPQGPYEAWNTQDHQRNIDTKGNPETPQSLQMPWDWSRHPNYPYPARFPYRYYPHEFVPNQLAGLLNHPLPEIPTVPSASTSQRTYHKREKFEENDLSRRNANEEKIVFGI